MRNKTFFDCFVLMGTALSIRGGSQLPDMARPLHYQGDSSYVTIINISLVLDEISIHQDTMTIEIEGIFSQMWIDSRLGVNEHTRKLAVTGKIWEPKIVNINGNNLMQKDDDTVFWRGFGDGNILLSKKIKISTQCSRFFQDFPFDIQHCDLKFGSYRFPDDEIILRWDETEVKILSKPRTTELMLLNVTIGTMTEIRSSGNFSIASVEFIVKRNSMHYIICNGAPCITMILLDYISLWMEFDKRWNVNLLSFSVTLYFYLNSLCSIQPVPYLKALDIFVGLCTCFSLISLLETFVVDGISKLGQKYLHPRFNTTNTSFQTYSKQIRQLELGMKITFPILYLLFVLLFGFIYVI